MKRYRNKVSTILLRRGPDKRYALIVILSALFSFGKAQTVRDLYYAQPKNTGLYLGFAYLSDQNFVLAGLNTLFLFNRQKLRVDSLSLTRGQASFLDNVNNFSVIDAGILSVSTLQRAWLIGVEADSFRVIREYDIRDFAREFRGCDLIVPDHSGLVARCPGKGKAKSHFYFRELQPGRFRQEPHADLTPPAEPRTAFKGSEIISLAKFQKLNDDFFHIRRKENRLSRYNVVTGKLSDIPLPEVTRTQAHEFYVDPIRKAAYLFKLSDDSQNKIFRYRADGTCEFVKETALLVRGIFDGKMYVSGVFDGAVGHFLIPLQGENEAVQLIER